MFGEMLGMFDMMGNYEHRKVKNTKINGAVIDTCRVTDSSQPYETGIQHPSYNDGKWIIVEQYDTKKQSEKGHEKWVKKMSKKLPAQLKDVSTCEIKILLKSLGGKTKETHKKKSAD